MGALLIVTRAQWGAQPARGALTPWAPTQPSGHTAHWEGAGGHPDHAFCAAEVRSIQAYHFSTGYFDIAYNWVVCCHGVAFEGRPVADYESAAQRAGNAWHIAICYLGGPLMPFSDAAKGTIYAFVVTADPVTSRNRIIGHRDEPSCATSCPGDEIEAWVKAKMAIAHGAPSVPQPAPRPKPLPPAGIHHPVLHVGNVGPAVMELQRKLNGAANQHLALDGNFGPRTQGAVEAFQRFFHLTVDGIAGPQTWGLLDYCAALKGVH